MQSWDNAGGLGGARHRKACGRLRHSQHLWCGQLQQIALLNAVMDRERLGLIKIAHVQLLELCNSVLHSGQGSPTREAWMPRSAPIMNDTTHRKEAHIATQASASRSAVVCCMGMHGQWWQRDTCNKHVSKCFSMQHKIHLHLYETTSIRLAMRQMILSDKPDAVQITMYVTAVVHTCSASRF